MKRFGPIAAAFAVVLSGAAHAATIDFESDTTGMQSNGFMSVDSTNVSFSDTNGAGLVIADFGSQSRCLALAVMDDDNSMLQMDFDVAVQNLTLVFGNDDPTYSGPNLFAFMRGFYKGSFVGQSLVVANQNDLADQAITLGGTRIDQAFFWYADDFLGTPSNLIEIVDNVRYELAPIPLPAGMPLMLAGLGGLALMRRRKKS
jgi:hypothetical protein